MNQDPAKNAIRNTFRPGAVLLVFALAATAMLTVTFDTTRLAIDHNQQQAKLALIAQVLPATLYDNDLLSTARQLPPDELLGTHTPSAAWLASRQGQATGLVLEAIAPDGYSGEIALLIGIDAQGAITGVRVTTHKETPGLGDYIDIAKSHWITQFNGKSLTQPGESAWKVKPDGGNFDARAGATITPRAVVKAVKSALQFFIRHRDELLTIHASA
jgi:electron transport complex protein RnfG